MQSSTETLIRSLQILAADIQSEDGVANAAILEASQRMQEMLELIDGCYEIVELCNTETHSQKVWKQEWLEKARQCGASSW